MNSFVMVIIITYIDEKIDKKEIMRSSKSKLALLFAIVAIILAICVGLNRELKIIPRIYYIYDKYTTKFEAYQHHKLVTQFPSENNGWKKYGNAPVFGYDENIMFDPYCFIENDSICMLVSDRKNASLITVKSNDGIHWKDQKTLITGKPGTWESIVNRGCLLKHNGKYYLWYTGQCMDDDHNGKSCIGLVCSDDGISFSGKDIPNPIITPELSFEGQSVMNPCVIYDEEANCFKMWYSAGETYEPNVINYAVSTDGINWKKRNTPVLEKGSAEWEKDRIGGCQVTKDADGYTIYYIGYQNIDLARICYAQSKDGINWIRPQNNLLLSPSADSWDSDAVYKPSVVSYKGQKLLFYNGRKVYGEYIGLATKKD